MATSCRRFARLPSKVETSVSLVGPPFSDELLGAALDLNNAHAEELSFKTPEAFRALLSDASFVRMAPNGMALIVAFHEGCTYLNPNFAWLADRFRRFYYIDRVVVSEALRGRGLARQLYDMLADEARAGGHERLVCEINAVPPNPQSDAFHQRLGFMPIGEQHLADRDKTVRYWSRELG